MSIFIFPLANYGLYIPGWVRIVENPVESVKTSDGIGFLHREDIGVTKAALTFC